MKSLLNPNIGTRGRLARAFGGLLLLVGALFGYRFSSWLSVTLVFGGAFMLFEAARGWCALRACGVKTRL